MQLRRLLHGLATLIVVAASGPNAHAGLKSGVSNWWAFTVGRGTQEHRLDIVKHQPRFRRALRLAARMPELRHDGPELELVHMVEEHTTSEAEASDEMAAHGRAPKRLDRRLYVSHGKLRLAVKDEFMEFQPEGEVYEVAFNEYDIELHKSADFVRAERMFTGMSPGELAHRIQQALAKPGGTIAQPK
jgi:hypothetical protein